MPSPAMFAAASGTEPLAEPVAEGVGVGLDEAGSTVTSSVLASLPLTGSAWSPLTVALVIALPEAAGVSSNSTVALAPLASGPRAQAMVASTTAQEPWLATMLA